MSENNFDLEERLTRLEKEVEEMERAVEKMEKKLDDLTKSSYNQTHVRSEDDLK